MADTTPALPPNCGPALQQSWEWTWLSSQMAATSSGEPLLEECRSDAFLAFQDILHCQAIQH